MRTLFILGFVLLAVSASPAAFAQATTAPANTTPAALVIPAGTGIQVKLQDELKSGGTPVGAAIHFLVDKNVSIDGNILIPKGAQAFGQVTESKKAAIFGQGGKLVFSCDYLVLPTGQQVALSGQPINNRGHDDRTATIISAVTDNWTDSFNTGGNVKVKKGQEFTVYVDHDTALAQPSQSAVTTTATAQVASPANPPIQPQGTSAAEPPATNSPGAPIDPSVIGTGKHVIVTLATGASYYGTVHELDSGVYTLVNSQGTIQIKSADISSVQYPDK